MRNKSLMKKLATLGMIATLTVGQSISALAVTGYYLSTPLVTKLDLAPNYTYRIKARAQASSDYSNTYLIIDEKLRYYDIDTKKNTFTAAKKSISNVTISSYIYDPIFSGRETNIVQSNFNRAIAIGYYTKSAAPEYRNDIQIGQTETAIY